MIRQRKNTDLEIDVPRLLDFKLIISIVGCGKCASRAAVPPYRKAVKMGYSNFEADMDVIRLIRRKRMHGFGLHILLNKKFRSLTARLAFSRPLKDANDSLRMMRDPTDITEVKDRWYHIDNLTDRDQFLLALIHRFSEKFYKGI
jgi:hypothetical protein